MILKLMGWKTNGKWNVEEVKTDVKLLSIFVTVFLVIYIVKVG